MLLIWELLPEVQNALSDALGASDQVKVVVLSNDVQRIPSADLIPERKAFWVLVKGRKPVEVDEGFEVQNLDWLIEDQPFIELVMRNLIESFDTRAVS